jgi:HEAT repeat protein
VDLASATVDELYALARSAENEDAYWEIVTELHGRVEERTFKLAEVLCMSFAAGERCLGADVLGQLGALPGSSAAESPFASESGRVLLGLLVEDDEPAVLSAAAVGLGHLRDDRAIDRLVELASHESADVRRSVVHGLMGHDDDRAVDAMIGLSADSDGGVRDWATFSLGVQIDRDTPAVRDALAARLSDSNVDARSEAIRGLARRRDERALAVALEAAADGGGSGGGPTVDEALVLLGASTGDARLRPHLERLAADEESRALYGDELVRALERVGAAAN